MDVKIKDIAYRNIRQIITPNDNLIMRCMRCQEFLLPRELHILKMPVRYADGGKGFYSVELCPVCHPDPSVYKNDGCEGDVFKYLSREEYEITDRMEKVGLYAPDYGVSNG